MNDLISRQAAIDTIVNTPTDVYSHDRIVSVLDGAAFRQNEVIDILNALPSAQQWIPVSERLPEEGVQVLVTDDAGGFATIDVDCGYFDEEYGRFEWFHSQNVTAWMPLPEPYKEKRMTILLNKSSEVEDVREMPNSEIEKYIQLAYKRESNRQILRERLIESKTYRDIIEKHWFFPAGDMMDEKAKREICAWINEIQRMETKFYRIVRRNRRTEAVERRRG